MEGTDQERIDVTKRVVAQHLQSLILSGVLDLPRPKSAVGSPPSAKVAAKTNIVKLEERKPTLSSPAPNSSSSPPPNVSDGTVRPPRLENGPVGEGASRQPLSESILKPAAKVERAVSAEVRSRELVSLRAEVAACQKCKELACTRKQTVFGVGNESPKICFFGEAPGADEDQQGEPFVGRAGQLLTKIIEAMGMKREDVFILNVLKCRPPGNRTPSTDEVANCRHFFERQLRVLKPSYIVCLGAVSSQALLKTTQATGRLRGRFHDYEGAKVVVTYHPAYLLRNPNAKKDVWDDMKMLLGEMGLPVPAN